MGFNAHAPRNAVRQRPNQKEIDHEGHEEHEVYNQIIRTLRVSRTLISPLAEAFRDLL
jgi:hypothetical protein